MTLQLNRIWTNRHFTRSVIDNSDFKCFRYRSTKESRVLSVKCIHASWYLCCNTGSRSTLFAATDPQITEYCELLKSDEWPVCAYISHDCRPANPSEEAHSLQTSYEVWEKTLEMTGLPSDSLERFLEGDEVECRYGQEQQWHNHNTRFSTWYFTIYRY